MNDPTASPLPEVRILGPVSVTAAGPLDPTHRHRLAELGAYLALTPPAGACAAAVDAAIWPGPRPAMNTRNAALSRLRRWWGQDETGEPYVERHTYRVRAWSDWGQVCALTGYQGGVAALEEASTADLTAALHLVQGRPFAGAQWRRYAWADRLRVDVEYLLDRIAGELLDREGERSYPGQLALTVRAVAVPWATAS